MTNGPAPNGMLPNLHAIVAVCDDWGIGLAGGMVVDNREDMRHFVACTKGHTVLMGRRTLESFTGGRPLRNRRNIVITTDPAFSREGVEVAHAIEEALALIGNEETWLIGGGMLYHTLVGRCATAEVTKNHCTRPADTFFPNLDEDPSWRLEHARTANENGDPLVTPEGVAFEFDTYVRA
ncbi:dihydrofolate reductase [Parolsenella catena]|uniref:dihydrofolate reductase n=1 Tax=Parolsenella catena TaxID=2003188 RepID=UPI002FE1A1CD